MEFRVTIDLDKGAFDSPEELAFLLRRLAGNASFYLQLPKYALSGEEREYSFGIYDHRNGNSCGKVEIR